MMYSAPKMELAEQFEGDEVFYAPTIPWHTLVLVFLITVGDTLII